MYIHFLGTGAGIPSKNRNVSSLILDLLQEQNTMWMFDCGEATQHQILHTPLKPRKIEKIFITHLHGDHIFGLPGFLASRSFQGGNTPLTIYGPEGVQAFIETALKTSQTKLSYSLDVIEVQKGTIFEDNHFIVKAKKLAHGVDSYGFRIIEKDKKGPLLVDKLVEHGITPGPVYQHIKEKDLVTLSTGEVINSNEFIGKPKKGKQIAIMGDTRMEKEHTEFVQHVNVLVHEATFASDQADLAYDYYHSTTSQAAQLAAEANVGHLLLTHISSRFQNEDYDQLLNEAQTIFKHTIIVHDFDVFEVE